MNRGRVSTHVFLCFLIMMFMMFTVGCSSKDDAALAPAPVPTYSVSGTVSGAIAAGVTMNLTGDATATTTTATNGTYSFTGLAVGNYNVIPSLAGYTFNPLSSGGTLTANKTGVDFAATAKAGLTYSISGAVSGAVLAGVTITLSGDAAGTTVTNASGNYSFAGIALNGNYTVTPSLGGYTFSAISLGVIVSGADSTGNNFTATANAATTYKISGNVIGTTADAFAGVTITLSGGTSGTVITTSTTDGDYSFTGLLPGAYAVTPSKTGYKFTPTSLTPTITAANVPGNNFTSVVDLGVTFHSIGGTVNLGAGTLDGVTINLTGAATASTLTGGGDGSYSFGGIANGAYTVTPVLAGYKFTPSSTAVPISGANSLSNDFLATANTALKYSISGTVSGDVKSGVRITLGGAGSGSTLTNASGNYSFSGLVAGSYTVTPTAGMGGYTSVPGSLSPTISSANITGQNFVVGTASTFSQADLTGTWYISTLRADKWMRARISINSSGVATCSSMSDSGGGTCPSGFDLTLTMNTSTGVITQTGAHAANAGNHMTMTSTKNLMVGTATNGTSPNYKYQLMIAQKMGGTYSTTDLNRISSFVHHQLSVGSNNEWRYGAGHTTSTGEVYIDSETKSSGVTTTTPRDTGSVISVTTSGIVTMTGNMTTYEGFLSGDKRTIVGTWTETGAGHTDYRLMIIQITATEFTAGALPAGVAYAHMLGCGSSFAGWIHDTTTVASDGTMTFSDWVDSGFGSGAPITTYTGNITDTGTVTITGNSTYHGQISHDEKFTVGTQTSNGYYFLNVTTK